VKNGRKSITIHSIFRSNEVKMSNEPERTSEVGETALSPLQTAVAALLSTKLQGREYLKYSKQQILDMCNEAFAAESIVGSPRSRSEALRLGRKLARQASADDVLLALGDYYLG
jgi:hypothetical protein